MAPQLPEDLKSLVGTTVGGDTRYQVVEYRRSGNRGHVFRAKREHGGQRALKFIAKDKLISGWEDEARKAHRLEQQPNTVRFYDLFFHGQYAVMVFDFVEGLCLRDLISSEKLSVAEIELILFNLLFFHRDCLLKGVRHGDLHPGNIIIRSPSMGPPRAAEVMVTDFGIGYTGAVLSPKEDLPQIGLIVTQMLQCIKREALDYAERRVYDELCSGSIRKSLRELSPIERGAGIAAVERLVDELNRLRSTASVPEQSPFRPRFGDYLAGEQIGDRWQEWNSLFVCHFPGYEDIISRNITVLTGTRGCGKTMVFRRLSALLTFQVGPVDELTAKSFIAFYLNMNDIGDAFLFGRQTRMTEHMAKRIIQFFHLSLLSEIVRVATVAREKQSDETKSAYDKANRWLFDHIGEQIGSARPYPGPGLDMREASSVLERAKEEVRRSITPLRIVAPLAENDWLRRFVPELQRAMPWIGARVVYLFLDDYSLPRVDEKIQRVLNSVIFRRSACFFFKISTESPSTFCRHDYTGKSLQEPDDFELTDLGSVTIHLSDKDRERFLDDVFIRRFRRDDRFRDRNLADVLGEFDKSWAALAREIRKEQPPNGDESASTVSSVPLYYGRKVFLNMWSGDTRNMVRIGVNLIDQLPMDEAPTLPVARQAQNRIFRRTGGEFLHLLEACTRTSQKSTENLPRQITSWGKHLVKIAEAFKDIALHELRTREGGRAGRHEPKQAFRIEIVDKLALTGIEREIYEDLVRYGVFLRDVRGKSVRGAIVPRLYLRRLLIPFCTLTFSKVDNIAVRAAHFRDLLLEPEAFARRWEKDRQSFQVEQADLFE